MLHHLGESVAAEKIEKSLLELYRETKIRTGDLGGDATTKTLTDALCKLVAA